VPNRSSQPWRSRSAGRWRMWRIGGDRLRPLDVICIPLPSQSILRRPFQGSRQGDLIGVTPSSAAYRQAVAILLTGVNGPQQSLAR